jgi:hypothetical protein
MNNSRMAARPRRMLQSVNTITNRVQQCTYEVESAAHTSHRVAASRAKLTSTSFPCCAGYISCRSSTSPVWDMEPTLGFKLKLYVLDEPVITSDRHAASRRQSVLPDFVLGFLGSARLLLRFHGVPYCARSYKDPHEHLHSLLGNYHDRSCVLKVLWPPFGQRFCWGCLKPSISLCSVGQSFDSFNVQCSSNLQLSLLLPGIDDTSSHCASPCGTAPTAWPQCLDLCSHGYCPSLSRPYSTSTRSFFLLWALQPLSAHPVRVSAGFCKHSRRVSSDL